MTAIIVDKQILTVVVNEGSSFEVEVEFLGPDGAAVTPTSVEYRIDDLLSGQMVRDWTSVAPGEIVTIPVTVDDTQILDDTNEIESREITVKAPYGINGQITDLLKFGVKNLRFL